MSQPLLIPTVTPPAATLTVELRPQDNADHWGIWATLTAPESPLPILSGQASVTLRQAQLHLKHPQGTLAIASDLPPAFSLIHQDPQTLTWDIAITDLPPTPYFLGTLQSSQPTALQAHLTVPPAAVIITDSHGLWPPDFSPSQLAIADRLLAQFVATPNVSPQSLGDRLQILAQHPSADLLTLVKLVQLNPQQDLAGGKFLGANLNGIDLSNADLPHSNFRGAILTDADLSDSNLSGSNFRGADLSGAYLENACLVGADFRKSSLALANLIGADLTHANLTDAALQNANFSTARLHHTTLSPHSGLTAEQEAYFQENGAKFLSESDPEMLS